MMLTVTGALSAMIFNRVTRMNPTEWRSWQPLTSSSIGTDVKSMRVLTCVVGNPEPS